MEHSKTCQFCGKSFLSSRSDALFCSANCRTKFSKRKKGGQVVNQVTSDQAKESPFKYSQVTNEAGLFSEVLRRLIELNDRLKSQEEVYLSPGQVCDLLSISKSTFDRYVSDGILKKYFLRGTGSKTKKKVYVKRSDVLDLFQEGE